MKSPKESFKSLKDTFTLSNGVQIPCVGFGTYLTPDGETAVSSVIEAVHAGYRHIDTAAVYGLSLIHISSDIDEYVRHFAGIFARKMGKKIDAVDPGYLDLLKRHAWRGNVRELRNVCLLYTSRCV